jgi:hypothetical protein
MGGTNSGTFFFTMRSQKSADGYVLKVSNSLRILPAFLLTVFCSYFSVLMRVVKAPAGFKRLANAIARDAIEFPLT